MSSVTQHQFLSHELLCRDSLDILSVPSFFVKETQVFCETCERKPGLHPGNCFKIYPTLKDYKIQR